VVDVVAPFNHAVSFKSEDGSIKLSGTIHAALLTISTYDIDSTIELPVQSCASAGASQTLMLIDISRRSAI